MEAALQAPEDARLAALLARWQESQDVDALDQLLRSSPTAMLAPTTS